VALKNKKDKAGDNRKVRGEGAKEEERNRALKGAGRGAKCAFHGCSPENPTAEAVTVLGPQLRWFPTQGRSLG